MAGEKEERKGTREVGDEGMERGRRGGGGIRKSRVSSGDGVSSVRESI